MRVQGRGLIGVWILTCVPCCYNSRLFLPGASGKVRIDSSGDREPDYSLKYYVNGSFQNIADYSHSTGGFNLRGKYTSRLKFKLSFLSLHISYNTPLENLVFSQKVGVTGSFIAVTSTSVEPISSADVSVIWAGGRTSPPSDKPRCGWDKELCLEEEKEGELVASAQTSPFRKSLKSIFF